MHPFFVLCFIAIVLESRAEVKKDIPRKQKILDSAEAYLTALETFDTSNKTYEASCRALATSIKKLLVATGTKLWLNYAAALFIFTQFRPDKFPKLQTRIPHETTNERDEDDVVDLMVQRSDNTFFVFKYSQFAEGHQVALQVLGEYLANRNGTGLFYEYFGGESVKHTVIAGLEEVENDDIRFAFLLNSDGKGFQYKPQKADKEKHQDDTNPLIMIV